jgi:RHS repeat-associated protein
LARLASANCGSIWSQTFASDVFSNLSKSGTISFQPTYNQATNRVSQVGGVTPTYDANGNLTYDGVHSYAWDSDANSVTIDSIGLTFDALDRMVEQARGTSYTQIVYGPGGGKLALMSGQTLAKGFVPLSGGATAVYTSGPTLSYYRHADWLGSVRLASTASQGVFYDGAYAPYGESYAEVGTLDQTFTGKNHDLMVGVVGVDLYDFPFRKYHPTQGRWISPDPERGSTSNPQLFNKYAYVGNEPTRMTDPLGLQTCSTFCYDPYYAIEFPGQCVGCPGALAGVDPCEDWYYAVTHAECPGPTGGPINISFGCNYGAAGGGTEIDIELACTITTGPTSLFGNCYYTAFCTGPGAIATALFHTTIPEVRRICNRPDINACPPKAAMAYTVVVRESPPPMEIVDEYFSINCSKLPGPPLPPRPKRRPQE